MTKTQITDSEWDPIYTALDTAQDWGLLPGEYLRVLNEWQSIVAGRVEQAVVDMRVDGATWEEVGNALGVSKQAAQQRYGR